MRSRASSPRRSGRCNQPTGDAIEVDVSLEAAPAVLYDALVLPDGTEAIEALRADGRTLEFIKDQYRHCKPILAVGASEQLLTACGIDAALPNGQPDSGVIPRRTRARRPMGSSRPSPSIGTSSRNRSAARVRTARR